MDPGATGFSGWHQERAVLLVTGFSRIPMTEQPQDQLREPCRGDLAERLVG